MAHDPSDRDEPMRLTDLVGRSARDPDGTLIGRVADLTVRIGDADGGGAIVDRLVVALHHGPRRLVPWTDVVHLDRAGAQLGAEATDDGGQDLGPDELLLVRDVLDTQIVDLAGRRLVRVGDVRLGRLPDGRLEAVAVDVGFGAVLRRLGLRAFARRTPEDAVAWDGLHLTSARGHTVLLSTTAAMVHHLDQSELLVLLDHLSTRSGAELLGAIDQDRAAASIAAAASPVRHRLARGLTHGHLDRLLDRLPQAHATHLRRARAAPVPDRWFGRHRPHVRRSGAPAPRSRR